MKERIITSDACVAEGVMWLADNEPRFAAILPDLTPLPLRLRSDGFAAVLSAIMGQQVSVASAEAVWAKLEAADLTTEDAVALATEDDLRACGLSRQKIRYAQALAAAKIDYLALRTAPTDHVLKTLTAVPGIGLWTAEIYAKFSLGRADVFAAGDLAVQIATQDLFDLPARPTEKEMRQMAAAWSPWRSVAARLLWAYYAQMKSRDGIR